MSKKKTLTTKETVLAFAKAWNNSEIEPLMETMDPKCIYYDGTGKHTSAEFREIAQEIWKAFPTHTLKIEDMMDVGNKSAVRYTCTLIPAGSDKADLMTIVEWDVVKDGKFIQSWSASMQKVSET